MPNTTSDSVDEYARESASWNCAVRTRTRCCNTFGVSMFHARGLPYTTRVTPLRRYANSDTAPGVDRFAHPDHAAANPSMAAYRSPPGPTITPNENVQAGGVVRSRPNRTASADGCGWSWLRISAAPTSKPDSRRNTVSLRAPNTYPSSANCPSASVGMATSDHAPIVWYRPTLRARISA